VGVIGEERAGIEPVNGRRATTDLGSGTPKLRVARAAEMPQTRAIRYGVERENLFDATIAVRRDDENALPDTKHDIMVKFTLLPVVEERVATVLADVFQRCPKREMPCDPVKRSRIHDAILTRGKWPSSVNPKVLLWGLSAG